MEWRGAVGGAGIRISAGSGVRCDRGVKADGCVWLGMGMGMEREAKWWRGAGWGLRKGCAGGGGMDGKKWEERRTGGKDEEE